MVKKKKKGVEGRNVLLPWPCLPEFLMVGLYINSQTQYLPRRTCLEMRCKLFLLKFNIVCMF